MNILVNLEYILSILKKRYICLKKKCYIMIFYNFIFNKEIIYFCKLNNIIIVNLY